MRAVAGHHVTTKGKVVFEPIACKRSRLTSWLVDGAWLGRASHPFNHSVCLGFG